MLPIIRRRGGGCYNPQHQENRSQGRREEGAMYQRQLRRPCDGGRLINKRTRGRTSSRGGGDRGKEL